MAQDLLFEIRDHAAFITLNREFKSNALTRSMISGLLTHLKEAEEEEKIRVVCITGSGSKVFCAGADLTGGREGEEKNRFAGAATYAELLKTLSRFKKPLVAKVNGHCLAGGLGLMLSCDIVIARNDVYFCTPEAGVGLFPMMIGPLLYQNLGRKKAVEMALTGRKIPAAEAEQNGLITRAVDPEHLDRVVRDILEQLISQSPAALQMGKEAFRTMSEMPFDEAVDFQYEAFEKVASTEDAREGMLAFLEKRPPRFTGK